jgi:hypothetical protein
VDTREPHILPYNYIVGYRKTESLGFMACIMCEIMISKYLSRAEIYKRGKGKAVPLEAWTGPWGSRRSRLPDF